MEVYNDNINVLLDKIASRRGPIPSVEGILSFLKTHRKLPAVKAFEILTQCKPSSGEKDKLKVLIISLYKEELMSNLVYVLELTNLPDIANEIFHSVSLQRPLCRANLEHTAHLQIFFSELKKCVDSPVDRELFLEEERINLLEILTFLPDTGGRSKTAHELAVVTWLRIQHCGRDTVTIKNSLHDMSEHWPPEVDKTFCDVIFHSKHSIAYILDGDIDRAVNSHRTARDISAAFNDCLVNFIVSHDGRCMYQRIYELNRSEGTLGATLLETETGLCCLKSYNSSCEEFIILAVRMFYLYIVLFRLKIHTDFRMDDDIDSISSDDLEVSQNVLGIFESSLGPDEELDSRRRMYHAVCRARLFHIQGHRQFAKKMVELALELADEGAHDEREVRNIQRYMYLIQS